MDKALQDLLLQPLERNTFTANEKKDLQTLLSNELVQRYFKVVVHNAEQEFFNVNDVDSEDQRTAVAARFAKMQGLRHFCGLIIQTFGGK